MIKSCHLSYILCISPTFSSLNFILGVFKKICCLLIFPLSHYWTLDTFSKALLCFLLLLLNLLLDFLPTLQF